MCFALSPGVQRTCDVKAEQLSVAPLPPPRFACVQVQCASNQAELRRSQQGMQVALLHTTGLGGHKHSPKLTFVRDRFALPLLHVRPSYIALDRTDSVIARWRSFCRTAWLAASQAVRYSPIASSSSTVVYRVGTDLPLRSMG